MRIAVSGRKGRTGKTTVAMSPAVMASRTARSAGHLDCDVEEFRGPLFLRPQVIETRPVNGCRRRAMPIFEYRCTECGHVTAFLEKPNTRQRHTCETCGSEHTEKVFSTFATKSGVSSSPSSCPTGTCPLS